MRISMIRKLHTHRCCLLPVSVTEMVVQCIASMPRSHFGSTHGNRIDPWPSTFGGFSIGSTNKAVEVEWEDGLACHDMGRKMKFRDEKVEWFSAGVINVHPVGIGFHPLPDIDAPLTSNIVRHNYLNELTIQEARKKHVIHVYVTVLIDSKISLLSKSAKLTVHPLKDPLPLADASYRAFRSQPHQCRLQLTRAWIVQH